MKQPPDQCRSLVDHHVGAKILQEMTAADLSTADLSEVLGVPAERIVRYCRGDERVEAGHLVELSRVFEIPLRDFFAWDEVLALN
jgi:transcriptional regulator with XRE-family HTH domain